MQRHHLEIDPSVVFQLGDSLISDEVTAIVELVKNAYDADATWARVRVDTSFVTSAKESFFPGCHGQVVVEDDGTGMDEQDIDRGWLIIANSEKRETKRKKGVTPKFKRTPLGDKGLGRLGVQRLGYVVELITRKAYIDKSSGAETRSSEVYRVGIDWRSIESHRTLSEVPVEFSIADASMLQRGTRVFVSELRNPSVWTSPQALRTLERKLGQFISPFEGARPFQVFATVNGQELNLVGLADRLRDAANMRFQFTYSEGLLTVKGKYALTAFRSGNETDKMSAFERTMASDRGREFYDELSKKEGILKSTEARYVDHGPWFIETNAKRLLDRLGGFEQVKGKIADPGPFHGEIDSFDFGRRTVQGLAGTALSDLPRLVQQQSGIRVYRDGFAIRPYGMENDDWLGLGARWTSGSSYYGLRPRNTVGYVSISADQNAQLEEKTDREGFVESPSTHNFELLMKSVIEIINNTTTSLRRQYNDFQNIKDRAVANVQESDGTAALLARVREVAKEGEKLLISAENVAISVERTEAAAAEEETNTLGEEIDQLVTASRQNLDESSRYAKRAIQVGAAASILERDLERLQDQLEQFAELAALGLTAEAISHELTAIASGLMERTRRILNYMRSNKILDQEILTYTEHVRSASSSLRKQLSHLDPGLRYARESTEQFSVRSFMTQVMEFYRDSFERNGIRLILHDSTDDFTVRINRGRFTQIIDNLFLNSRYWLQRDTELGAIERAELHVALSGTSVFVWDTGRGIDPGIEDTIFEPFVTNKPKGEGRGLGLFIVRQLLQANGSSITLMPESNSFGSRYMFRLELESVAS